LKEETKTHEDDEDPGVVPIIEPLRLVLDAIKPENTSGWMFPNVERLACVSARPSHEPS
jgi:hypothetical protein